MITIINSLKDLKFLNINATHSNINITHIVFKKYFNNKIILPLCKT